MCFCELWRRSDESATAHLEVGSGEQCTTASNLPAEPVAAFRGLKHMLYKTGDGGGGWGGREAGRAG